MTKTANDITKYLLLLTALFIPFLSDFMMSAWFVVVALIFFIGRKGYDNVTFAINKHGVWLIMLSLFLVYGFVFSISYSYSLSGIARFGAGMVIMMVIQYALRRKSDIMLFIQLIIISSTLVAGYGILQYFIKDSNSFLLLDTELHPDIATRVTSIMQNPNNLAAFLIMLVPLALGMFFYKKKIMHKLIALAITGIMLICIVLTYSRGAYLGVALAVLIMVIVIEKRLLLLAPFGIGAMMIWMPAGLSSRIDSLVQTLVAYFTDTSQIQDTSAAYRLYIWNGVERLIDQFWLFGAGIGNQTFKLAYGYYMDIGVVAQHAHSTFLEIIAEFGVIGFVVIFGFILKLLINNFQMAMESKSDFNKIFSIALISGTLGLLVYAAAEHVWYYHKTFYMFFVCLGLLMAIYNNEHVNKEA